MKRAVTVGELLLRLSPPGEERLLESPQLATCFGGAEANVAVALSHLGVRCDYVTRLPANPLGDAGLATLAREGVGTEWISRGGERLGLYFVEPGTDLRAMRVVYDRQGSAFAGIDPGTLDWSRVLERADWLHVTGITPALGDGPSRVVTAAITHARAARIPVSLDLNFREALWRGRDPRPLMMPLVEHVDVLIGNAAAVTAMLGLADRDGPLPARLATQFGCRFVAVTRRELLGPREQRWSAVLYEAATGREHESRAHQVGVVDRVGGGDSFAAGLIARLLAGDRPDHALEFAAAAGALKLTRAGDFGRANVRDVEAWLHR